MTLEFILAALDPCNACPEPRGDCPPECTQRRAFEELQKHIGEYKRLKEKETPKKPYDLGFDGGGDVKYWKCPNCGYQHCTYIVDGDTHIADIYIVPHCDMCGQKIDWSGYYDN